ncbi:MAG: LysR family transcriptional regulator [Peptococcaceae bacterium]
MRLNQFEFLVALNSYGSFSKTAEKILISQPAISRAVKELEEELGYDILKRGKKGVEFTEKGRLVLEKAMIVMDAINEINDIEAKITGQLIGRVRIGSGSHHCSTIVLNSLINLQNKYPGLIINILREEIFNIIRNVAVNELDIGVILLNTATENDLLAEIKRNNIYFEELFNEEMCIILGDHHPLAGRSRASIHEIIRYPFVTSNRSTNSIMLNFLKQFGYQNYHKGIININDIGALRNFLTRSNTLAAVPKSTALESNKTFNDRLLMVLISDYRWNCRFGWLHKKQKLSIAEKRIKEELLLYCKRYQDGSKINIKE